MTEEKQVVIVKTRGGCVDGILLLFFMFIAVIALFFYGCSKGCQLVGNIVKEQPKSAVKNPESDSKTIPPPRQNPSHDLLVDQTRQSPPLSTEAKKTNTTQQSQLLDSFEGVSLPCTVVVIGSQSVNLLNAAGKEISFPENTIITINKRSDGGTLTMQIHGKAYVGNEYRLSKKTMLR
jgi:hypothetical protein